MPNVYVFYDYVCPYAYLGKLRADRLADDFDVNFVWVPWEIFPEANPAGEPIPEAYHDSPSTRWVRGLVEELGETLAKPRVGVNSNLALRGAEYAKDQGGDAFAKYHTLAFEAVWTHGKNLGERDVLREVAEGAGLDADAFFEAIAHNGYQARLYQADRIAERLGVQRVPTFVFGDQRIVGNDPFEESLKGPLTAFLKRWNTVGEDRASSLEEDVGLAELL